MGLEPAWRGLWMVQNKPGCSRPVFTGRLEGPRPAWPIVVQILSNRTYSSNAPVEIGFGSLWRPRRYPYHTRSRPYYLAGPAPTGGRAGRTKILACAKLLKAAHL